MLQHVLLAAMPRVGQSIRAMEGTADAAPPHPPTAPAAATLSTSVQMLVALAATEAPADLRRRIAKDSERGLKMLERFHAELVGGAVVVARLEELRGWAEAFAAPDDPQLAALAREIDLRVRVELAKHDIIA